MNDSIYTYRTARGLVRSGDVLLHSAAGIKKFYDRAAMAAWWNGTLLCLEMPRYSQGLIATMSSQITKCPSQWYVFRVTSGFEFDVRRATEAMIRMIGTPRKPPGFWSRLFDRTAQWSRSPKIDSERRVALPDRPLYEAAAIAYALTAGGDLEHLTVGDWTIPLENLAHHECLEYRFTIDGRPLLPTKVTIAAETAKEGNVSSHTVPISETVQRAVQRSFELGTDAADPNIPTPSEAAKGGE